MVEDTYRHKGLRKQLIKILRTKGIRDEAVLQAMMTVPRHFFFDTALLEHAYDDKAFPIGEGQTISQPYTVAFQTELLQVRQGEKVLEIGTGSGYQAAILLELGVQLYTIEYNPIIYKKGNDFLKKCLYKYNHYCADGSLGLPAYAPYHKIIVTAGCPAVPAPLIAQLSVGGRLVIPVGNAEQQQMLLIQKINEEGETVTETHPNFSFVPLLGKNGWKNKTRRWKYKTKLIA